MLENSNARIAQLEQQLAAGDTQLQATAAIANQEAIQLESVQSTVKPAAGQLNLSSIIQSGIEGHRAKTLETLHDQRQLDLLQLRDNATRNDWLVSDQFLRAVGDIDDAMRLEPGDEEYEQYLIATDQPVRVSVNAILDSSVAQNAGIQAGDIIVDYNGERIFTIEQLRRSTAAGRAGEEVIVNLLRDGESIQTFVPRGPLGIRANADDNTELSPL